jgi:hypothetical protein
VSGSPLVWSWGVCGRAEIKNGDAWTDFPPAAKSEVDKVMADLCGPAETQTRSAAEFRNKGMHPFIRFVELARTEKTQRNPVSASGR